MIAYWSYKNISDSTPFIRSINIPLYVKYDVLFEFIDKNYILMALNILKSNYISAYQYGYYWLNQHVEHRQIKQLFDYVHNITFISYLLSKGEQSYHTFQCIHNDLFTEEMIDAYEDIINKNIQNLLPFVCCNDCKNCDFYGICKWIPEKMLLNKLLAISRFRG